MSFPIGPHEEERLEILLETGALDATTIPALNQICDEARAYFGVPICTVTLLDRSRQLIRAAKGMEVGEMPRDMAFCNYTILNNDVFVINDAQVDDRFSNNPLVTGAPYIRFYAGAPLIFLQNIRLGALCLVDMKPRAFSPGDKAELQVFADRAVTIIAELELANPYSPAGRE
jgi:GAF domain-containing protein